MNLFFFQANPTLLVQSAGGDVAAAHKDINDKANLLYIVAITHLFILAGCGFLHE